MGVLRSEGESAVRVSSYMAEGLDCAGFSCSPCQTVPHGGRGVGGWMERVLLSQRQHHGVRLRERERERVRYIRFNYNVSNN